MKLEDNNMCFACGDRNPFGLKLKFKIKEDRVETQFTPKEYHQGYNGIMHGGIMATLLDEALIWAAHARGIKGVTAWLEIRLKKPVSTGEEIKIEAKILNSKGNIFYAEAIAKNFDDSVLATAKGKIVRKA
ncbi:MAG TPA: PaaI family thioesterase [bacterium (Candidatus Stahlbacteria)]|nr:PaaI family thioesterase [Candidatus Stahlbacteria bacterium]